MTRYIAFLRGINVSGPKLIKMEELRKHFEIPGFKNVVTYIQSGNVLFDAKETDTTKLRAKIEKQLAAKLGYEVAVIVRSIDEIKQAIKRNPYPNADEDTERKLYVTFLSDTPDKALHASLDKYKNENEEFRILEREVYLLLVSYGNTKLSNALIEKKLGLCATTRNWATLNKILEL